MDISLVQILNLVGKLDDSQSPNTARDRFRQFLKDNITSVGHLRDYVGECLRNSGDQYNRALQDLINYTGQFLGFEVVFGRYQGVQGQIGFDGHWKSPSGFHFVVETKTTDVYTIKASTLVNYVDVLISEKKIPNWDDALGLYVVGRPDAELKQLHNAIIAEKRTHQLRIISVESLLTLAEMMTEFDINHDDITAILRPSKPQIDPIVDLIGRIIAQKTTEEIVEKKVLISEQMDSEESISNDDVAYWLTPVKSYEDESAEECIRRLVEKAKIYAYGERTRGRKHLKPGDCICFYASSKGIVAYAKVASKARKKKHPAVRDNNLYPWIFDLSDPVLFIDSPVPIDAEIRLKLDAFKGKDPMRSWAWYVQGTTAISEHDFKVLTRLRN